MKTGNDEGKFDFLSECTRTPVSPGQSSGQSVSKSIYLVPKVKTTEPQSTAGF